ncbi:urease accessory protein UreE [Paroceanicella profunda]|uniref:Urease accessory protein UreE n=1 Tax=Paroceanicella profunda TaxID=2579971 RepID=A0A5B8FGD2_9RHOB|nr:urease accessory protein UreE [Paroceanicella profunda]QDL91041.1 urease accessory protein UreE [Paroceanicella profunda]
MTGAASEPLLLTAILGHAGERGLHERLHALEHRGRLEVIAVPAAEAARRRMRVTTDRGRACAIALERSARLSDGAVLHLGADLAIVARIDSGARLRLRPHSVEAALRLGHCCGNLHWKVDFTGDVLEVILDGPEQGYLDRLADVAAYAPFDIIAPEAPR